MADEIEKDAIAERIEKMIEARGTNPHALAGKANLSPRAVSKILERGRGGTVSVETILAIAEALEVPVSWLLTGRGMPSDLPANDIAPTLGNREGFEESLPAAKVMRPHYDDRLWQRVIGADPMTAVPMSPELVARVADILFSLAPPKPFRR